MPLVILARARWKQRGGRDAGSSFEQRSVLLCEQRVQVTPQVGVSATREIEKRATLDGRERERFMKQLVEPRPTLRRDAAGTREHGHILCSGRAGAAPTKRQRGPKCLRFYRTRSQAAETISCVAKRRRLVLHQMRAVLGTDGMQQVYETRGGLMSNFGHVASETASCFLRCSARQHRVDRLDTSIGIGGRS
jgi:hypothetical protein